MMDVDYSGRDNHVARLFDFLSGCRGIRKWQAQDLHHVLDFLILCEHGEEPRRNPFLKRKDASDITELLAELAGKARSTFPADCFFQLVTGELEMRKGPLDCNRSLARECFERVLKLAEESNDSDGVKMVKRARESLDLLDDADKASFGRATPSSLPFVEEDDDDEDDEDDEPFTGPFDYSGFGAGGVGRQTYSLDDLPQDLIAGISRMCREMGVDPVEFLNRTAADGGVPFRFRAEDAPSSKKKRK
jgi:hypothetical protein